MSANLCFNLKDRLIGFWSIYFDELKKALKSLNDKMNIVGFDFVEVNPKLDVGTNVTSYLGALTVAMFLGFIDEKRRLELS